jgi:predicted lipid-binding transport protein (Tim44 family)
VANRKAYAYIGLKRTTALLSDPINIILLAAAVIIFWKLKSVLGQRTGVERPPFQTPVKPQPNLRVIENPEFIPPSPVWQGHAEENSDLAKGLDAIAKQQKDFSVTAFMAGAKGAHEMILEAYAKGDKAALKPLLSKNVYENFLQYIEDAKKKGQNKVFQFVGLKSAKIKSATLEGTRAAIAVLFISETISALVDKDGSTVEGDAKSVVETTDYWTFERDLTSSDPNWKLVAADDPAE